MILDEVPLPIVLAPLAGGPSTPELTAAVCDAGGFGVLASGYLSVDDLRERIAATRALTRKPFGVNVFVPGRPTSAGTLDAYLDEIRPEAQAVDAEVGTARFDDDAYPDKVDLLVADPPPVVSFTFGLPARAVVDRLHAIGAEVWVTVTTPDEALRAERQGADLAVVQGREAGGHRGGFDDDATETPGLLALLQLTRSATTVPMVATGGVVTGAGIAAVLCAGARAAALGTAFLDCPEAGTTAVHREALRGRRGTAITRAFTGRSARGIRNDFLETHSATAPAAYPEVHHATAPMRAAARQRGDAERVNLWAGETFTIAPHALGAAELVVRFAREATESLGRVQSLLTPAPDQETRTEAR